MFLKKLLRCRPYVHIDCHFRFDARFREIRVNSILRCLRIPKRRNDDNHQLEVPTRHLKPDFEL